MTDQQNFYGIKDLRKKLIEFGWNISDSGLFYNVYRGNIPHTAIINANQDGKNGTYVFTDTDLASALEYARKNSYSKNKLSQK